MLIVCDKIDQTQNIMVYASNEIRLSLLNDVAVSIPLPGTLILSDNNGYDLTLYICSRVATKNLKDLTFSGKDRFLSLIEGFFSPTKKSLIFGKP